MTPTRRTVTAGVLTGLTGLAGLGSAGASAQASTDTTIDYEGKRLTLESAPEQVVSGRTGLSSGVELTVRLRASGSSPFIKSAETSVDGDGTFEATFDLTGVEAGTSFTASVLYYQYEQASVGGAVEATNPRISFDYEGQVLELSSAPERTVSGDSALPEGTGLSLRLRSNRSNPFVKSTEPTVGADGGFDVTFDLSDIDPGTYALLEAYWDDERRTFAVVEVTE